MKTLKAVLLILYVLNDVNSREIENPDDVSYKRLSRRRRYVTFPEGASFSMATCITVGVIGNPMPGIFTWGLNWGISYGLPNQTVSLNAFKKFKKLPVALVARRLRRDLYSKMELIINDMGYNGRECIFRSLCEAAQKLIPRGGTIVEELFRTIFTLPLSRVLLSEPPEHLLYDDAHRSGLESIDCHKRFKRCPFSLLDLAMGYYTPRHNTKYA